MRQARYKESYQMCLHDLNFAEDLAKQGTHWHKNDKKLFYTLFKLLYQQNKDLALRILKNNAKHFHYEKLSKKFNDDDEFTLEIS